MKVVWKLLVVMVALVAAGFAVLVLPMIIADLPRTNFQKNLKKRATAEELQTWAAGVLTAYQTNRDPGLWIELTNIPVAFHGLYKWGPSAYVYSDSQARFDSTEPVAYVKVTYGSAAGHFGVIFGPTNLPTPTSSEHEIRYAIWKPGAWLFDGQ